MTSDRASACSNCLYSTPDTQMQMLICRRYPPSILPVNFVTDPQGKAVSANLFSAFPMTKPELWCGEFEESQDGPGH